MSGNVLMFHPIAVSSDTARSLHTTCVVCRPAKSHTAKHITFLVHCAAMRQRNERRACLVYYSLSWWRVGYLHGITAKSRMTTWKEDAFSYDITCHWRNSVKDVNHSFPFSLFLSLRLRSYRQISKLSPSHTGELCVNYTCSGSNAVIWNYFYGLTDCVIIAVLHFGFFKEGIRAWPYTGTFHETVQD